MLQGSQKLEYIYIYIYIYICVCVCVHVCVFVCVHILYDEIIPILYLKVCSHNNTIIRIYVIEVILTKTVILF